MRDGAGSNSSVDRLDAAPSSASTRSGTHPQESCGITGPLLAIRSRLVCGPRRRKSLLSRPARRLPTVTAPSIPPPESVCGRPDAPAPARSKLGCRLRETRRKRSLPAAVGVAVTEVRRNAERLIVSSPGQGLIRQPHQLARHALQLAADTELGLSQIRFPIRFHSGG